jgi:hypothetical protein
MINTLVIGQLEAPSKFLNVELLQQVLCDQKSEDEENDSPSSTYCCSYSYEHHTKSKIIG